MFASDLDYTFDWHLTNRCNFLCDYCHPQIRHVLNKRDLDERSPEDCVAAFDALGRCGVLLSGGEPFEFPDFVELCRLLTRRHVIAINTNLSNTALIEEFAASVSPSSVSRILAAVHVEERMRNGMGLDNFARGYDILRQAGFDVVAAYVLHPTLLPRAREDFTELRRLGVDRIAGKVFKGIWEKRRFPLQYSDLELLVVRELIDGYRVGKAYLDHGWDFRGLDCSAGQRSFKVMIGGDVRRCVSSPQSYGNIFARTFAPSTVPGPCGAKHIRVLSECVDNLVTLPPRLSELVARSR